MRGVGLEDAQIGPGCSEAAMAKHSPRPDARAVKLANEVIGSVPGG